MTGAKAVRFAAVLVVLAGYAFVFRAGETRIGERLADNERLVDRLRAGARTLASRTALERERARLQRQLRVAELTGERGTLVARFLGGAATAAAAHRTAITAIAAAGVPTTAARGTQTPARDEGFEAIPLELTVEGRYADVLATMRALSAERVLASVDVVSLARKNASSADATLTAVLRVALERLVPSGVSVPAAEPAGVRARPL